MIDSKLIDSSIWLEYIINGGFKDIIDSESSLILSTLSLFEIKKKMLLNKYAKQDIKKSLDFIKSKSLLMSPSVELCEKAADISVKNKLPMADSIIYTTALESKCKVFTLDNHFKNLEHAKVLD
ncbi:PIN domain-containing protein [Candidatus Pacearchaeota archaeon]|nr:PIN domain-containing protein [Candidatus Pacearchaeota archaeon]